MSRMRIKSARKDKRIFKQTAQKTKAINLRPNSMRGGIRL